MTAVLERPALTDEERERDDALLDPIAVERACRGERSVIRTLRTCESRAVVVTLTAGGASDRAIGRILGIDHVTVRRWREQAG